MFSTLHKQTNNTVKHALASISTYEWKRNEMVLMYQHAVAINYCRLGHGNILQQKRKWCTIM